MTQQAENKKTSKVRWLRLYIGMILTLVISLSIHLGMLQGLRVPFPEFAKVSAWASFLNTAFSVFALLIVSALAQRRLVRFSSATAYVVVFLVYAMLRESLRAIVMNGVVTTGWRFDVIAGLPGLASALVLTSLVVAFTRKFGDAGLGMKTLAAAAITGVVTFAARPFLSWAFGRVLESVMHFNHEEVYPFPYGWHVLVPAYLTYAEPVVACMALAALIWQRLSMKPSVRLLQFALIVLLVRGMLIPTFVYSFYSTARFGMAMLSQSQFLFETFALGILTGLVWQFSTHSEDRTANNSDQGIGVPGQTTHSPMLPKADRIEQSPDTPRLI